MTDDDLALVEPSVAFEAVFLAAVEEFRAAGEQRWQGIPEILRRDFAAYVRRLQDNARGVGLARGLVPSTTYWLVRGGTELLGASSLRHRLNPALEREGGHIGYAIRPLQRRKGYGTRILALTLEKARERGFPRVLVTCDTDNVASARIIRKNGGVFEDERVSTFTGRRVSRYWIDL